MKSSLKEAAQAGRLYGLLSLMFAGELVDWTSFDKIVLTTEQQSEMFINAMLENVLRGAERSYCFCAPALKNIRAYEGQINDGLSLVERQKARPDFEPEN